MIIITQHAIDRYQQRVDKTATPDAARAAIEAIVKRADGCATFADQVREEIRITEHGIVATIHEGCALVLPVDEDRIVTCYLSHEERCIGHRGCNWGQPCQGEPYQYCAHPLDAGMRTLRART